MKLPISSDVSPISCIPFPQGLFHFFPVYNPTAVPSPAVFPSCIRRLTHCSAPSMGHGSTWLQAGPGRGTQARPASSSGLTPAPVCHPPCLCQGWLSWGDGSAFPLPPRMAAALTPPAFGHGPFNIFLQFSHLQSLDLLLILLPWVKQLLIATTSSALQPDAFQLCVLQGETEERVPSLHLHHITGIQNGTESYFSSLDVGKVGWSASAKALLSSAACNSCLSKRIIWGLSQSLLSRSQFF